MNRNTHENIRSKMLQPKTVMVSSHMSVAEIAHVLNDLNIILAALQNSICNLRIIKEMQNGQEMDKGAARRTVKKN